MTDHAPGRSKSSPIATAVKLLIALICLSVAGVVAYRNLNSSPADRPAPRPTSPPRASNASAEKPTHTPAPPAVTRETARPHAAAAEQGTASASVKLDPRLIEALPKAGERIDTVAILIPEPKPALDLIETTLIAQLREMGYTVLDRRDLDRILREQKLTGLSLETGEQAIRLGQIASADVLVELAQQKMQNDQMVRVRVMEPRAGLVLADRMMLAERDDLTEAGAGIAALAVGKADFAAESMKFVTLAAFKPENDDMETRALAAALQPLVSNALTEVPDILLLDREASYELIREAVIAGGVQTLPGTSLMIDGSVRRLPGDEGYRIAVRMTPPGAPSDAKIAPIDLPAPNATVARDLVIQAIRGGIEVPRLPTSNAKAEAKALWVQSFRHENKDYDVGIAKLEAAFALDPVPNYIRTANQLLYSHPNLGEKMSPEESDRFFLNMTIRRFEYHLRFVRAWMAHHKAGERLPDVKPDGFNWDLGRRIHDPNSPFNKDAIATIEDLYAELVHLQLEAEPINPDDKITRMWSEIQREYYWRYPFDRDEFISSAKEILEPFIVRNKLETYGQRAFYNDLNGLFQFGLDVRYSRQPQNEMTHAELRPLAEWFVARGSIQAQVMGMAILMKAGDGRGRTDWAIRILDAYYRQKQIDDPVWDYIPRTEAVKLLTNEFPAEGALWVRNLVDEIEQTGDITPLLRDPREGTWDLFKLEGESDDHANMRRAIQLVEHIDLGEEYADRRKKYIAAAHHSLRWRSERDAIVHIGDVPENPWHQFVVTPVSFTGRTEAMRHVIAAYLDPAQAGSDRTVTLLWASDATESDEDNDREKRVLTLTRAGIHGGVHQPLGQASVWIEELNAAYNSFSTPFANYKGRYYVATHEGLLVFSEGKAKLIGIKEGATTELIRKMVQVDKWLLLVAGKSHQTELMLYDADAQSLLPLTSPGSAEGRSALDGVGFRVDHAYAINGGQKFGFDVTSSDYGTDRIRGWWFYEPRSGEWSRRDGGYRKDFDPRESPKVQFGGQLFHQGYPGYGSMRGEIWDGNTHYLRPEGMPGWAWSWVNGDEMILIRTHPFNEDPVVIVKRK